jgi:ATP-binding cassette, subfamily B, bacterial
MKVFTRADGDLIKKTIAIYKEELKSERKSLILAAILVPSQHFLYIVLAPLIIGFFAQSVIQNPHDTVTPLWLAGALGLVGIGSIIFGRFGFITLFNHDEHMTSKLLDRSMKDLLRHSHTFFANSKVGALAGDINTFSRSYMLVMDSLFLQASPIIVSYVASLIIVAIIAPIMVPVLLLLTILIVWNALYSFSLRAKYRNERKEMTSKLFGNIADVLGNQTLVRMFGSSKKEVSLLADQRTKIEDLAEKEIRIAETGAGSRLVILFLFQIVTLLIIMYLTANSLISIAAFIFIITYLGRITSSMYSINSVIRSLEQAFIDASKITEILYKTPEVRDASHAQKLIVKNAVIEFKDVEFSYEDSREQIVFKNLNLVIKQKQSIGLVGKSGGGKSTLTHLLLRYMDIDKGIITIDGQDIANVTQDSLRDAIAYVPQDPYLFHRSLRDNIAYGNTRASDAEIIDAARKAYAMEFIEQLPAGLDTIVGERGVKLSGGQRQRIAIARAILKDAPILLLDEATSALDSESEIYIQKALEQLMKGRTSIVIAHRLSTIAKLDRIIVLSKGKIIEDGKHTDLIAEGGVYGRLWKHQSGGFIQE